MSLIGQYNARTQARDYHARRQAYRSGLEQRDEARSERYTTEKAIAAGSPIDPELCSTAPSMMQDKFRLHRV